MGYTQLPIHSFGSFSHYKTKGNATVGGNKIGSGKKTVKKTFPKRKPKMAPKTKTKGSVVKICPDVESSSIATGGIDSETIIVNKPSKLQYVKACTKYQQDHKIILNGPAGIQTVTDLCAINTVQGIVNSQGVGYAWYQANRSFVDLDPSEKITGSAYIPAGVILNKQYQINFNKINIEVSNSGTGCILDIYLVKCKVNTIRAPSQAWDKGLINEASGLAASTIVAPAGVNATAVGYPSILDVGQKPTENKFFKKFYHVEAVKSMKLNAGSTEIVNFVINHKQRIKQDEIKQFFDEGDLFCKHTYSVLLVQRGIVGQDITNPVAVVPTYMPTQLAVLVNCHTYFGTDHKYTDRPITAAISQNASNPTTANSKVVSQVVLPVVSSTLFM